MVLWLILWRFSSGVTRGFDVPAGVVVLMVSTGHAAVIGSTDFAMTS